MLFHCSISIPLHRFRFSRFSRGKFLRPQKVHHTSPPRRMHQRMKMPRRESGRPAASPGAVTHAGVVCDDCGMNPIRGVRYRCGARCHRACSPLPPLLPVLRAAASEPVLRCLRHSLADAWITEHVPSRVPEATRQPPCPRAHRHHHACVSSTARVRTARCSMCVDFDLCEGCLTRARPTLPAHARPPG